MAEWRVTFGYKYANEVHSLFPEAHPDGWLTIEASNEEQARDAVVGLLGDKWAFIYGPDELHDSNSTWSELYPRGELQRIEAI